MPVLAEMEVCIGIVVLLDIRTYRVHILGISGKSSMSYIPIVNQHWGK